MSKYMPYKVRANERDKKRRTIARLKECIERDREILRKMILAKTISPTE